MNDDSPRGDQAPRRSTAGFWPEGYQPGRADHLCLTLLAVASVYGIVLMLARPVLLGYSPLLLASLTGSRSALVTLGAQYGLGATTTTVIVTAFILSSFSLIKVDLLFWWAGRLWGDFFLTTLIGDSPRKRRRAARAEALARRYAIVAILVSNIPVVPVPKPVVFAVLGMSGASFRKIFVVDLLAAFAVQALWLYLGFTIGEPVVQTVEVIARYSLWISLAMMVVAVGVAWRKGNRDRDRRQDGDVTGEETPLGERRR